MGSRKGRRCCTAFTINSFIPYFFSALHMFVLSRCLDVGIAPQNKGLKVTWQVFYCSFSIKWTKSCFSHESLSVKSTETKHPTPNTFNYDVIVLWSPHTQLLAALWCVASTLIASLSLLSTLIQTLSLSSLIQRMMCRGITYFLGLWRGENNNCPRGNSAVSVGFSCARTWRKRGKHTPLSLKLR